MPVQYPKNSKFTRSCNDTSKKFAVENPATGQVITEVQAGNEETTLQAIKAAELAYEDWRWRSSLERGALLLKAAGELEKHAEELAEILCLENGKPYQDALAFDVQFVIRIFQFFGSLIDKLPTQFYDKGSTYCTVVREPLGICAGILPFNWPPIHTGGKLAPALAAGNVMILKPGEQAPLTVMKIVEILQTVLPPNVVQAVPGLGPEVPQALVSHPSVKMISFTGSTTAGAAVSRTAAATITPVVMELGGKNAFIVFEDANLERAVRSALEGAFFNKGEACTASSRILVHESLHVTFVEKLSAAIKKLVVGNGMDSKTHVGPCVSKAQQERVLNYLKIGQDEGAQIAAQANMPADPACKEGFFVPPTLLTGVSKDSRIFREEIFGPVVSVTPFSSEAEAVTLANASQYGLTAVIFTADSERQMRVARKLDVGMVWINNYFRSAIGTPFGGVKESGHGREHCIETLLEYTSAKMIRTPSGLGEIPLWRGVGDVFGRE